MKKILNKILEFIFGKEEYCKTCGCVLLENFGETDYCFHHEVE